jgi:hypothetical protein
VRSVRVLDYTVFPCPEGNVFFVPVQDVLRQDWSFTVPVGGIDNIGRNRQTRGVTAQLFHDFYAVINTCDKMTGAFYLFGVKNIVRTNPDFQQFVV